jgi:hypothetical protein
MALWSTYDVGFATGSANREDLLDMIVNLDIRMETPFFTSSPKSRTRHTTHEWLVDSLTATSTAAATVGNPEGAAFSSDTLGNRTRLQNITQIFRKDIDVSETQRAVDPAGVSDEYEHQIFKGLKEVARNVETGVFKISSASATGDASTARLMRGIRGYEAVGINIVGTANTALALITTALVMDAQEAAYNVGGNPNTLYTSPGVKRDFTAAAGNVGGTTRNIASSDRRTIANIDIFEGDFGMLAVVPDRFIPQATVTGASAAAFLIESSLCRLAFLRPLKHVPMGKGSDSTRGIVVTELTLEVMNPSALAIVTGITT